MFANIERPSKIEVTDFKDAMKQLGITADIRTKQDSEETEITTGKTDKKGEYKQITVYIKPNDDSVINFSGTQATLRVRLYEDNTMQILGGTKTIDLASIIHLDCRTKYLLKTADNYGPTTVAVNVTSAELRKKYETDMNSTKPQWCLGTTSEARATISKKNFYVLQDFLALWFINNGDVTEDEYKEAKEASFNRKPTTYEHKARQVPEATDVVDVVEVDAEEEVPL